MFTRQAPTLPAAALPVDIDPPRARRGTTQP